MSPIVGWDEVVLGCFGLHVIVTQTVQDNYATNVQSCFEGQQFKSIVDAGQSAGFTWGHENGKVKHLQHTTTLTSKTSHLFLRRIHKMHQHVNSVRQHAKLKCRQLNICCLPAAAKRIYNSVQ